MKLEVLVSTMNQKDLALINKMNLATDAIIINQTDCLDYKVEEKDSIKIRIFSFNEKGIGRSRNNALMRSNADICVIADDDMVYVDGYEKIIIEEFKRNPKADVIIFNVKIIDEKGERIRKQNNKRVRFYNSLKYGAVRIAFRREKILKENISFSLLFGGGALYGSGEDSIFITDCLKKGLKIYTSSQKIADVYNYDSTWFTGYNNKFFFDKGALFAAISSKFSYLLSIQFVIRHYSKYKNEMKLTDALRYIIQGSKSYRSTR